MRLYLLKRWFSALMFWNKEAIKNIPYCRIRILIRRVLALLKITFERQKKGRSKTSYKPSNMLQFNVF